MRSYVDSRQYNRAFLYKNNHELKETKHETYSGNGAVRSTSGRVVTLEASVGDKIVINATKMDGTYLYIDFCAEYSSF